MADEPEIDVEWARAELVRREKELADLLETAESSTGTVELDQTRQGRLSRMDALQGQAMAQETQRRRRIELKRVRAALERIAAGDYGFCVSCDEPIAANRLKHDLSVPQCVSCAQNGDS